MEKTLREQMIELVNKLFIYTDTQNWNGLMSEVFTESVRFDMSSLGLPIEEKSAQQICNDWEESFKEVDAVNHLAGNYLVETEGSHSKVFCYATATHYKESAVDGQTRNFIGSYELGLTQSEVGWRIDSFKYTLKYMTGNIEMV